MVRGRRSRNVVSCLRNGAVNSSIRSKKKDKIVTGKLDAVVFNGSNNKTQSITDFFQAAAVDIEDHKEASIRSVDFENGECMKVTRGNDFCYKGQFLDESFEIAEFRTELATPLTPVVLNKMTFNEVKSPPTPHRIEFCSESTDLASRETSSEAVIPSKPIIAKARLKLNNNSSKQPVQDKSIANNHKLTEYFPVRRSVRKTKKIVLEEKQRTFEEALRNNWEEGLKVSLFDGKGRGVITTKTFRKGEYVVEYSGDLIDLMEAKRREEMYAHDQNAGCYMYYFKHSGQQYCIDATPECKRLGRLVNHSRNGNLLTKTIFLDGKPRLVLIAKDDIQIGEEITYDYGDRSKESLKHHPWLAF